MKLSIITATFNCVNDIEKTAKTLKVLKSLNNIDVEWVVIDGASTDGTVEYLQKKNQIVNYFISEEDSGIYDAWNKAVKVVTGDWVLFLGAGDTLIESNIELFFNILNVVNPDDYKLVYGNVRLLVEDGTYIKKYSKVNQNDWTNSRPALPSHQGTFQHVSLFSKKDVFDTKYKIAADSKFLLESMEVSSLLYVDIDISNMQSMGVSTNPKHILRVKRELSMLKADIGYQVPVTAQIMFSLKSYIKHFITHYLKIKLQPRPYSK